MAAYNPLPWLNVQPSDFLRAITSGADDAARRASIMASSRSRPQMPRFAGGFQPIDPREQAAADMMKSKTKLAEEEAAATSAAWAQYQSLTSRGATPAEAYEQAGLGRFGVKPSEAGMLTGDKTFEIGNEVVKVNPQTGESSVLYSGPEKPTTERRYAGPMAVDVIGRPAGSMSLTLPEWAAMAPSLPDKVRTNSPVANYVNWGRTNAPARAPISAPAAPAARAPFSMFQVPMGGYGNMEGGSAADYTAPAREQSKVQEVIRRTKDGRRAVYDAKTKQFIRYAQ